MAADPWALRTFAILAAGLAVLSWVAVAPPASVDAGRSFVTATQAGDEAAAQALFTDAGWRDAGRALFAEVKGRPGHAYGLSPRARDAGFVMVEFPDGGRRRRYLLWDAAAGAFSAVRPSRPGPPKGGGGP